MPFVISGHTTDGSRTETRIQAASAIVLALRWEVAGLREVRIREGGNAPESADQLRRRLYRRPYPPLGRFEGWMKDR